MKIQLPSPKAMLSGTAALLIALSLHAGNHGAMETQPEPAHGEPAAHQPKPYSEPGAIAMLEPTEGNDVEGVLRFLPTERGIRVVGTVTGLTPGKHGFHVHAYGDRRSADGTSLGGHFNPTGQPHSGPDAAHRHIGDLGNIVAGANGVAKVDFIDPLLTFSGPRGILGRGLVVHAGEDDLTSQPTGAAGARVAVGVIGVINPELD